MALTSLSCGSTSRVLGFQLNIFPIYIFRIADGQQQPMAVCLRYADCCTFNGGINCERPITTNNGNTAKTLDLILRIMVNGCRQTLPKLLPRVELFATKLTTCVIFVLRAGCTRKFKYKLTILYCDTIYNKVLHLLDLTLKLSRNIATTGIFL